MVFDELLEATVRYATTNSLRIFTCHVVTISYVCSVYIACAVCVIDHTPVDSFFARRNQVLDERTLKVNLTFGPTFPISSSIFKLDYSQR
jgi:hypothetical protein